MGLGPFSAFVSSITWAIGSTGYSRLSRKHSPFAVNFSRALLALPMFIVAAWVAAGGIQAGIDSYRLIEPRHVGWFTASMIASYGLGDTLFLWSSLSIGVPGALAIGSAYPIWTALFGYLFHGEALGLAQMAGLLLTVSGVVIVILNGPSSPGDSAPRVMPRKGILLAVATSLFWAVNSYAVAQGGRDLPAAVGNTIRMALALGISAIVARAFRTKGSLVLPLSEIRRSWWIFVIEAFAGSYTFVYGMSHSTMAVGSTLSSLAPVLSVPMAWAAGLEKFSLFRTLGICTVVLGLCILLGSFGGV